MSGGTTSALGARPDQEVDLDPRARRTRRDLRAALRALAAERELDDISVAELTAAAGVNRATFYDHFTSKDALVLDTVDALMADTAAGAAAATDAEVTDPAHPPRHTLDLFRALEADAALYRRLLGPAGSPLVQAHMRDGLRAAIAAELARRTVPARPRSSAGRAGALPGDDVVAAFVAGAIVGVAAAWLADDHRVPADEIAAATWVLARGAVPAVPETTKRTTRAKGDR